MKLKFLLRRLPDKYGPHKFYYNSGTPIIYTKLYSKDMHDLETLYFSIFPRGEIKKNSVVYELKKL